MKIYSVIAVLLIVSTLFASCTAAPTTTTPAPTATEATATETATGTTVATGTSPVLTDTTEPQPDPLDVKMVLADFDGEVPLLSRIQEAFIKENDYNSILKYCDAETENSRPRSVKLKWTAEYEDKPDEVTYTVRVSEDADFNEARTFECDGKKTLSVSVYNLKPGTKYYWNVTAKADGKQTVSETKTLLTADSTPWVVYVEGVTNCRDIGGWATSDGGHVKRDMIFRTAGLNNNCEDTLRIEASGIDTMLNVLKVKSEIDLRGHLFDDGRMENGITSSVLGDSVNYYFCPLEYNQSTKKDTDEIRRVFGYFADEANYPIFFHCSIGTDRTGMIATILEALLGVSEHDIYMDYVFSNFGALGAKDSPRLVDDETSYLAQIRACGGNTPSEWAHNYLLSIGVSEAEINEIIRIMKVK